MSIASASSSFADAPLSFGKIMSASDHAALSVAGAPLSNGNAPLSFDDAALSIDGAAAAFEDVPLSIHRNAQNAKDHSILRFHEGRRGKRNDTRGCHPVSAWFSVAKDKIAVTQLVATGNRFGVEWLPTPGWITADVVRNANDAPE